MWTINLTGNFAYDKRGGRIEIITVGRDNLIVSAIGKKGVNVWDICPNYQMALLALQDIVNKLNEEAKS